MYKLWRLRLETILSRNEGVMEPKRIEFPPIDELLTDVEKSVMNNWMECARIALEDGNLKAHQEYMDRAADVIKYKVPRWLRVIY